MRVNNKELKSFQLNFYDSKGIFNFNLNGQNIDISFDVPEYVFIDKNLYQEYINFITETLLLAVINHVVQVEVLPVQVLKEGQMVYFKDKILLYQNGKWQEIKREKGEA